MGLDTPKLDVLPDQMLMMRKTSCVCWSRCLDIFMQHFFFWWDCLSPNIFDSIVELPEVPSSSYAHCLTRAALHPRRLPCLLDVSIWSAYNLGLAWRSKELPFVSISAVRPLASSSTPGPSPWGADDKGKGVEDSQIPGWARPMSSQNPGNLWAFMPEALLQPTANAPTWLNYYHCAQSEIILEGTSWPTAPLTRLSDLGEVM